MAADPIVYCLEQLTDYDQFERLSHDMMALDGYRNIEPLGGKSDKGRDAIHMDGSSKSQATVFAYSVREDWRRKLGEDCDKVRSHGHTCNRFVFVTTSAVSATDRDVAIEYVRSEYGWECDLYSLERLRSMFATTHRDLVARHPQIFCPPFFPVAGGLSVSPCLDHIIIDHADADTAVAQWLARRLTLAGYHVWCRGLAPIAGSSINETVRSLLITRAFFYVCVLSRHALADANLTARRSAALATAQQRSGSFLLPAIVDEFDHQLLDQDIRVLASADFSHGWKAGLDSLQRVIETSNCPQRPEGARDLVIRSYLPQDIVLDKPETLASNLFSVVKVPQTIHRFCSQKSIDGIDLNQFPDWPFRRITSTQFLSFQHPPDAISKEIKAYAKGGAVWAATREIDGIRADNLVIELIRKTLYSECRSRGMAYCDNRDLVYFPFGLLKNDHLSFKPLTGRATFFTVAGERTKGKGQFARRFRYHIAPVFAPKDVPGGGYEIIVRIRLRVTDTEGKPFTGRTVNARRKDVCKSWWNDEWLKRTMGVMQFLANGADRITIGQTDDEALVISSEPRTWQIAVSLNQSAIKEAVAIREEEDQHLRTDEDIGDGEDDD